MSTAYQDNTAEKGESGQTWVRSLVEEVPGDNEKAGQNSDGQAGKGEKAV